MRKGSRVLCINVIHIKHVCVHILMCVFVLYSKEKNKECQ